MILLKYTRIGVNLLTFCIFMPIVILGIVINISLNTNMTNQEDDKNIYNKYKSKVIIPAINLKAEIINNHSEYAVILENPLYAENSKWIELYNIEKISSLNNGDKIIIEINNKSNTYEITAMLNLSQLVYSYPYYYKNKMLNIIHKNSDDSYTYIQARKEDVNEK